VRGAAVLGRFAAEVHARADAGRLGVEAQGELLWGIMVEMTPPGTRVVPAAGARERRVLEAKYRIFREAIEVQKRWRGLVDDAVRGREAEGE